MFLGPSISDVLTVFDCCNAFHAAGARSDPLLKSPIFIVGRFDLHLLHEKLNFKQLLFSSYFEKIKF